MMWTSAVLTLLAVWLVAKAVRFIINLKRVSYLPGFRSLFPQFSLIGASIPTNYFNPGLNWQWLWRKSVYNYYGTETISWVSFFGDPVITTSSMEVAKQVLRNDPSLIKAPEAMEALLLWGDSILTVNHGAYRKHKRVVGPAFSPRAYTMAARDTVRFYHEMVEGEEWLERKSFTLDAIDLYLSKFTLGIISRCGFGLPFPWLGTVEEGEIPFEKALAIVSDNVIIRLATPKWAYKLPIKRLHSVDEAYRRLATLMRSFIAAKKEEFASSMEDEATASDLFTRLISASESEGKNGLDDHEVIGNVFSFLFAGHETTAHASTATLALLALYEEEQEKVVKFINEVLPDGRDPTFDDFASLDKVLACFHEAVRMFPGGSLLTRDTTDTVPLKLSDDKGNETTLVVPPGTRIIVDMIGIHYNPRHFPDPERYDPSRWYDVQSEVDLTFFGLGPRACIGRKFALTVGVCLLTCLLRDWKFSVPLKPSETKEMWRKRVLQGDLIGLSFGVHNVPLTMTRRVKA